VSTQLEFHPVADMFPLMEGEEFEAFVADIKANAVRQKMTLHEGKILDGRNRYRAMLAVGDTPTKEHFSEWEPILPGDTPLSYVISANMHRRHLTAEQKRDLIAKLLKAQPEKSNRQIAEQAQADHKTVGAVRAEQEGRGEIPHVTACTDTKGRQQPAKKAKSKPEAAPLETRKLASGKVVQEPPPNPKAANVYIGRALKFTAAFYNDIRAWRDCNDCLHSDDREALFNALHQAANTLSMAAQLFLPTPKEEETEKAQ
jgi:hypothetical protein